MRIFCGMIVLALMAAGSAWAQIGGTPVAPSIGSALPDEFLLPNRIIDDPTDELRGQVELSEAQVNHMRACFAVYAAEAASLTKRAREQMEREGHWKVMRAAGVDATPAQYGEAGRSTRRAKRAVVGLYIAAERRLVEQMLAVVSESQRPAFHRQLLAILRRTWFEIGPRAEQDFFQFADPISLMLEAREGVAFAPEAAGAFEVAIGQGETRLAAVLPERFVTWNAAMSSQSALADADPAAQRRARKETIRAWLAAYRELEAVVQSGSAVLRSDGHALAAMDLEERFWRDCFPDLVGREETPGLYTRVLTAASAAPEASEILRITHDEYRTQRHELLRKAVSARTRDFKTLIDPAMRRERLYLCIFGVSSRNVGLFQIRRCRLSMEACRKLEEHHADLSALRMPRQMDEQLAFDSTTTLRDLAATVKAMSDESNQKSDTSDGPESVLEDHELKAEDADHESEEIDEPHE